MSATPEWVAEARVQRAWEMAERSVSRRDVAAAEMWMRRVRLEEDRLASVRRGEQVTVYRASWTKRGAR